MPSIISHYEIVEKLGEGGMGVVYKARDTRLKRLVALKVLPAQLSEDSDRRRRFDQEARAASALNHPNIVTIYDIGEADGTLFIAMECVEGATLDALIPRDGLPMAQVFDYAIQVADAVARAHAAGIVHRDLKPANIMVTPEGLVKVLDFGLAKLVDADAGDGRNTTVSMQPHTVKGVLVGTPSFMSPEQAAGRPLDARSDVFSLGAVLYEMASGRRAFRRDSHMEAVAAVLSEEPAPLPANIHPELARLIQRCLRKDPARRYQSMADLKVALEDARDESAAVRETRRTTARRWTWGIVPVLILAAGYAAWRYTRHSDSAEPLQALQLTTFPGLELYPSFSPDGNQVAFAWSGPKQDNQDIWVQMIGSGSPLRLTTDSRSDTSPAWSPDGRWIAFLRGEHASPLSVSTMELRLIAPLGGPERKLTDVRVRAFFPDAAYLAWASDSSSLVVTDSTGEGKSDALFVISVETGEKRQLTRPESPVVADTNPAVAPDGLSVAFRRRPTWSTGELYVLPLGRDLNARGEPTRLTTEALDADQPAWTPDGKELLFSARKSLWRVAVAGSAEPARLPFVGEDGSMPAVSRPPPGQPARLAYVRSFSDENIWRIETAGPGSRTSTQPALSISSTRSDIHPHFSPDGRKVAFTSTRSGDWEIWVSDPDGANAVRLTSMGAHATGAPRWSPDGQTILFASDTGGQFEIYRIPAAGGRAQRLTSNPALDHAPGFSSDGRSIYFTSNRSGEYRIWKMPAAGGEPVQVTDHEGFVASESPDGAHLYYAASTFTGSSLWHVATSGGRSVKILDGMLWGSFAVLDKGIYYIDSGADHETRLRFFDFNSQTSTTVARGVGNPAGGLTATRDGRSILYARVDSSGDDLMLVDRFR